MYRANIEAFLSRYFAPAGSDVLPWSPNDWTASPPVVCESETEDLHGNVLYASCAFLHTTCTHPLSAPFYTRSWFLALIPPPPFAPTRSKLTKVKDAGLRLFASSLNERWRVLGRQVH